jgi:cobalt-zinc-cadmium efflux system membrane fusion protein
VLERSVTPGGAVTPGAGLFVISDLSTLWALAEIDETKIPRTHIGQPVEVFVTAYPDRVFSGDIIFVADTLDPKTRRITVRCRVPNEEGLLKPQMFATIALGEEEPRKVAVVPHAAVQQIDGDSVVFLAQDDGTFQRRQVRTGGDIDGSVEILEGLKPGDRIVSTGSFLLKSELLRSAIEEQE